MSRKLGSKLETTKPKATLIAGEPAKPESLSPEASRQWDKLLSELDASGITLSPAHRAMLVICSTLAADIRACWAALQANGGDYCKAGTGAVKLHPAAARLDVLRRDLAKNLSSLGLQRPLPESEDDDEPSLEDVLSGKA